MSTLQQSKEHYVLNKINTFKLQRNIDKKAKK